MSTIIRVSTNGGTYKRHVVKRGKENETLRRFANDTEQLTGSIQYRQWPWITGADASELLNRHVSSSWNRVEWVKTGRKSLRQLLDGAEVVAVYGSSPATIRPAARLAHELVVGAADIK